PLSHLPRLPLYRLHRPRQSQPPRLPPLTLTLGHSVIPSEARNLSWPLLCALCVKSFSSSFSFLPKIKTPRKNPRGPAINANCHFPTVLVRQLSSDAPPKCTHPQSPPTLRLAPSPPPLRSRPPVASKPLWRRCESHFLPPEALP